MDKLTAALCWLKHGAKILPCQEKSKKLVQGFGKYLDQLVNAEQVEEWFYPGNRLNLAILCPADLLVLDFDDPALYNQWRDKVSLEIQGTYTETTRRGFHVFIRCELPAHVQPVAGVEFRAGKHIMVAPSELVGFRYTPINISAPIIRVDYYQNVCSSLQAPPTPAAISKHDEPGQPVVMRSQGNGLVARIKLTHDLVKQISTLTEIQPRKHSKGERYWEGVCPWHDDHHPSLWIDTEKQTWGCWSCDAGGSVIDFYALQHGLTIPQAIRELAGENVTA